MEEEVTFQMRKKTFKDLRFRERQFYLRKDFFPFREAKIARSRGRCRRDDKVCKGRLGSMLFIICEKRGDIHRKIELLLD